MAAEEGMETPPQDLLLDLPVDVGAVEGGDRYRRRLERAATATGRGGRCHHFVGGHFLLGSYDYCRRSGTVRVMQRLLKKIVSSRADTHYEHDGRAMARPPFVSNTLMNF